MWGCEGRDLHSESVCCCRNVGLSSLAEGHRIALLGVIDRPGHTAAEPSMHGQLAKQVLVNRPLHCGHVGKAAVVINN